MAIVQFLGASRSIKLYTNNPEKVEALRPLARPLLARSSQHMRAGCSCISGFCSSANTELWFAEAFHAILKHCPGEVCPLKTVPNKHNMTYLTTKRDRLNHKTILSELPI